MKVGKRSSYSRVFDGVGILGFILVLPLFLSILGVGTPLLRMQEAFGVLGEPGLLLLVFLVFQLLASLFGSANQALPVLAGLGVGALCFGSAFDIPYLDIIREWTFRLPILGNPIPSFIVGVLSIVSGNLLGKIPKGRSGKKALALLLGSFLLLVGLDSIPALREGRGDALSVEAALSKVYSSLNMEYRDPRVEAQIRKIIEEKNKTLAEKEQALEEIAARLKKAEEDRIALSRSNREALSDRERLETRLKEIEQRLREASKDREAGARVKAEAEKLRRELEATQAALREAQNALKEARESIGQEEPLLVGRDYGRAIQPRDPVVRDFAVRLAGEFPGPYDEPQGSRVPSDIGLRQLYRLHQFVSSQWKYVSDPNVDWFDYASPARRTIGLGLAGDCDDFAILVASLIVSIGGRVRILHGYTPQLGHAWAEVWMGSGITGENNLKRLQKIVDPALRRLVYHTGTEGGIWLVLDWTFGNLSIRPKRMELAWSSH